MKKLNTMKIVLVLFFLFFQVLPVTAQTKPKVIVLTDIGGDTDDEQSLVRFLHYADHFEIMALCATSRLGHGQDIKQELILEQLRAYRQIYPNLLLHSEGFPDPDYLQSLVKLGLGNHQDLGEGFDSEASKHIIRVVEESQERVHIAVWGGLRELAQALWRVKETRSAEQLVVFCDKIQVHAIGDQDLHRTLIIRNFPDVRFIANGYAWYEGGGIRELSAFRGMYMTGDMSMQDGDWVRANIHGNGPLSEKYKLHGHGTNGMKEGDSPSFMGLIRNGLNVPEKPEWGGWGGRFRLLNKQLYIDAPDFMEGTLNERHSVARWRPAFQRDFMARVKWGVESYENANHNPQARINGHEEITPLKVEGKPGGTILLDASESSDPDGNRLTFHWFVYEEIYKPKSSLYFENQAESPILKLKMPEKEVGGDIHLILEVSDDGMPSLTTYKRIIISVK